MQFGLVVLGPASGIAMLFRAVFGIAMLCLAVPVVWEMWSLRKRRPRSGGAPDLDELRKRYTRGEIS